MDVIHEDVLAAAEALQHATRRMNLLVCVARAAELSELHPYEFLAEIMSDISVAASKINHVSRRLLDGNCHR